MQYYLIPNKIISKSERPKWRFLVKNLYKEIVEASKDDANKAKSADLLSDFMNC